MLISSRSTLTISRARAAGSSMIIRKTNAIERKISPCDTVMDSFADVVAGLATPRGAAGNTWDSNNSGRRDQVRDIRGQEPVQPLPRPGDLPFSSPLGAFGTRPMR